MKTVSFVIPVYNPPEERLRALLDSVLSQEGVGIEVVAVNDGATNGAPAILREFEAANPGKMIVVDRRNAGEGPSRNEGFRHATGDYVWFVDADDLVRPGAAAYLADAIERSGADMVLFPVVMCLPRHDRPFPAEWTGIVRETTPLGEISRRRIGMWSKLCRRSFLERAGVRLCGAITGEDGPESYRWALEARSLAEVPDPCYKWFQNPGSVTHSTPTVRFFAKSWEVMDRYDELRTRFPEYAQWFDHWNFIRARGLLVLADRFLREAGHSPEELAAVRDAREECRRRFERLDARNPLVALYDFSRDVGRWDLRPALFAAKTEAKRAQAEAGRKVAAAEKKAAAAAAKAAAAARRVAAMERSLSWRLTAPLRAVLRPFARKR